MKIAQILLADLKKEDNEDNKVVLAKASTVSAVALVDASLLIADVLLLTVDVNEFIELVSAVSALALVDISLLIEKGLLTVEVKEINRIC